MKYVYTAVFTPNGDEIYTVTFPDIKGCVTEGNTLDDSIAMASDALCLTLYDMEESNKVIPPATRPDKVKAPEGGFCSVVSVDTAFYRRYYNNKAVKKTLTIPAWLNERAEEAHINFSGVLQSALKEQLHIDQ